MSAKDEIVKAIESTEGSYHRLILLVGVQGSGKTSIMQEVSGALGIPLTNINLELSNKLMTISERKRPLEARTVLSDILQGMKREIALLDNIELLFDRNLKLDSLRLLQTLSRNKTIVSTWNGAYEKNQLSYASPGHPEYRREDATDTIIIMAAEKAID
jgi:ABC-type uncharacterized transport system ATPase component